jgi:electron transport complex protein RnfB
MDPLAVALIDEARCIGCALCLPACPVDAISGAAGHMHTVIARHCTGCELCIPACPVDCIAMSCGRTERNRNARRNP